jgi:hypothetical protein
VSNGKYLNRLFRDWEDGKTELEFIYALCRAKVAQSYKFEPSLDQVKSLANVFMGKESLVAIFMG